MHSYVYLASHSILRHICICGIEGRCVRTCGSYYYRSQGTGKGTNRLFCCATMFPSELMNYLIVVMVTYAL